MKPIHQRIFDKTVQTALYLTFDNNKGGRISTAFYKNEY